MKPITISLVGLWLMALAVGCAGCGRYDGRLVQADSLMWDDADSALAIVVGIGDSTLRGEHDRAYRDLLLTQARYKAYQPITARDDSAITRALHWYRAHNGEREKFTRATLYKGAVMEELGHVDSAMIYYKTAEAAADTTDYINLGQINIRIGKMYRWYYGDMQTCFDKYRKALKYNKITRNKRLQFESLLNMGACSSITHIGNSKEYLSQASRLAIELNDSAGYYNSQELLCRQLYYKSDSLSRAKQIALYCMKHYRRYITNDLLLDLADIYIRSGMPDSARYYIDLVKMSALAPNTGQLKDRLYMIMSRITRYEGDVIKSSHYAILASQVSDSILNNKKKFIIQQKENSLNFNREEDQNNEIYNLHRLLTYLIIAALILPFLFAYYHYRKIRRINKVIEEVRHSGVNSHNELLQ